MLWLLALHGCNASDDIPAPTIASIFPDQGTSGQPVTIVGSGFCQQPAPEEGEEVDPLACDHVGDVVFDSTPATLGSYTDTSIEAIVPDLPPGSVLVVVRVAGRVTRGVSFQSM